MKLNIKTPMLGLQASSLIRTTEKIFQEFSRDFIQISEADVRFIHGSTQVCDKVCQIYLKLKDKNIFVVEQAVSFEASAVKAVKKLKSQIKKSIWDK